MSEPVQRSAVLALTFACACVASAVADVPSPAPVPSSAAPPAFSPAPLPSGFARREPCDNAGFLALEAERAAGDHEVTVCGNVAQVLPERTTASGKHKYFFVTVDPAGDTIEIVTNVDVTGEFDVKVGALANVHGRYYRDSIGTQGIDWTHHNAAGAGWPYPGYVQLDGGPLVD